MRITALFDTYRSQIIFVIKLILIYAVLYLFVNLLIGLTSVGGALYWDWLDANFDLITHLRNVLLNLSQKILELIGYDVQRSDFTLNIQYKTGIRLVYACLGLELICGYSALILAYPFQGRRTYIYLFLGIILIEFLNVIRISALTVIFSGSKNSLFTIIDHHDVFNLMVTGSLIVVYLNYLKHSKLSV